ncbi:hypothetical protein KK075_003033 [Escherichia coli]|nr:hypothetical protein [Escherichia coli]EIB8314447.1 hypothetical protein [Escherichia coli]ELS9459243.1 hypothetical protein [Escherichia coli]ELW1472433.1 hypothetical protein [Escherichia coli]ELY7481022.1 hypothetical protein [Escherichia coli]
MSGIQLDIDAFYSANAPVNSQIRLTCPTYLPDKEFVSPIIGDLVIGGTVSTSQPFATGKSAEVQEGAQKINQVVKAFIPKKISDALGSIQNIVYKQRMQTIQMYQDAEGGDISLQMIFIVTSRSNIQRYRDAVLLTSCVFPETDVNATVGAPSGAGIVTPYVTDEINKFIDTPIQLMQALTPPCGYSIVDGGKFKGTWNIRIGNYFSGKDYILKSASMNQSKARLAQNEALITTVDCQFDPAYTFTAKEFRNMFGLS